MSKLINDELKAIEMWEKQAAENCPPENADQIKQVCDPVQAHNAIESALTNVSETVQMTNDV